MKKVLKVLLVSVLALTLVTGCKRQVPAQYAKAGLGVVSTYSEGKGTTTFAAVGLDSKGVIQYVDLDVAQSGYNLTKKELGDDYGMKSVSAIMGAIDGGAEWYEQAAAFEAYCVGKTLEEVKATELSDGKPAAGTDLAAGCTVGVTSFIEVLEKAVNNAVDAESDSIVLGRSAVTDEETSELSTTLTMFALDAQGKVVYSKVDIAQVNESNVLTKSELGDDYGMKDVSAMMGAIEGGAEWYEQAAAFETYCTGKTLEEVKATELTDGKATGTDLAAGCTIGLTDIIATVAKAK